MEYINHYTLWTNHMRRTYTDEVSEESRKMINIHTANLRPTKSLGVRETESMAVGD